MPLRTDGAFCPATDAPRIATPGNPWIQETDLMDWVALVLNGFAKRCTECRRPARVQYLRGGLCPDCRQQE